MANIGGKMKFLEAVISTTKHRAFYVASGVAGMAGFVLTVINGNRKLAREGFKKNQMIMEEVKMVMGEVRDEMRRYNLANEKLIKKCNEDRLRSDSIIEQFLKMNVESQKQHAELVNAIRKNTEAVEAMVQGQQNTFESGESMKINEILSLKLFLELVKKFQKPMGESERTETVKLLHELMVGEHVEQKSNFPGILGSYDENSPVIFNDATEAAKKKFLEQIELELGSEIHDALKGTIEAIMEFYVKEKTAEVESLGKESPTSSSPAPAN